MQKFSRVGSTRSSSGFRMRLWRPRYLCDHAQWSWYPITWYFVRNPRFLHDLAESHVIKAVSCKLKLTVLRVGYVPSDATITLCIRAFATFYSFIFSFPRMETDGVKSVVLHRPSAARLSMPHPHNLTQIVCTGKRARVCGAQDVQCHPSFLAGKKKARNLK